ncbi:D-alanyl-D-alanine carboxypeptidase/D-alanyl-D-alanine-endopeptidase [Henriciella sp. AS95]|uniref:D-alanyl-D-alanine carboxypeptidase/D-alanyl-D-alanine endopeptidase n=1 Tax=Henriciella sp. AS95 TaxID=3135782 RepID=UPI003179BFB3
MMSRWLSRACRSLLIVGACTSFLVAAPIQAQTPSANDEIKDLDLKGGNIGISVVRLDGTPVLETNAQRRFLPASSQKLLTTIAAFHFLGDFENSGWPRGTVLTVESSATDAERPNVRLIGTGDVTLSVAPDCQLNCLSTLAETLASSDFDEIGSVIVDDTLFRPPYRPDGWSHDDLKFAYGAAVSALSADRGEAAARISAPRQSSASPLFSWTSYPAFETDVSAVTMNSGSQELELDLQAGSNLAVFSGNLPPGTTLPLRFGLADPTNYVGQVFRAMLIERGVNVTGGVVRSSPNSEAGHNSRVELARYALPTPNPSETIEAILHESSNIDSEVLLQHISLTLADRTPESGIWLVEHILAEAGAEDYEYDVADGSGLSVYNRLSPGAMTSALSWASQQEWYEAWYPLIAANGEDGTLSRRFVASFLPGMIRAKTGSVYGTDALAGYFTAASGEQYAFAVFINDSGLTHRQARRIIDDLVLGFVRDL